jgi:hypothetical protein
MELTEPPVRGAAEALSPSVKWPGRESDISPPSSAKVKNDWSYSATYIFMACALAAFLLVYGVRENVFFFLVVVYGKFNDSCRRRSLQGL